MTRGDDRLGQLEVTISFGDEAVVGVHGDVDLATAPDLGAVLAAAPERRSPVVVDLAATHFLGLVGVRILEVVAQQLAACGRRLTNQPLQRRAEDITCSTRRFASSVVPEQKDTPCFAS